MTDLAASPPVGALIEAYGSGERAVVLATHPNGELLVMREDDARAEILRARDRDCWRVLAP